MSQVRLSRCQRATTVTSTLQTTHSDSQTTRRLIDSTHVQVLIGCAQMIDSWWWQVVALIDSWLRRRQRQRPITTIDCQ